MGERRETGDDLTGQAVDWLVALDHGDADQLAFERWRGADPRHAAAFAQVAAIWRRTGDRRMAMLAPSGEIAAAPNEDEPAPAHAPLSRRAVAGGLAAAVVGLGAGGAFLAWPRRAYAETVIGERRTVALPDGSRAMLNTNSRVAWRFDDGRDFWVERGEAALLVRAAARPFRIHSDPIDARLSPGAFNLRLDRNGGALLVRAGRAAAAYRNDAETIEAGHLLVVSGGTASIDAVSPSAVAVMSAWQHGEIIFRGMSLDAAVAEFNRYLPDKIVLGDDSLAATRLGGNFRIAAPEEFLAALHDGFGIDYRREGDRIVLFRGATPAAGA